MKYGRRSKLPRGLRWDPKSPYICFSWRDEDGRQHQQSTDTADPAQALVFKLQFLRNRPKTPAERRERTPDQSRLPLSTAAELYFEGKRRRIRAGTSDGNGECSSRSKSSSVRRPSCATSTCNCCANRRYSTSSRRSGSAHRALRSNSLYCLVPGPEPVARRHRGRHPEGVDKREYLCHQQPTMRPSHARKPCERAIRFS